MHRITTAADAEAFAARWAEAWNRRAADTVLEHFHDDVVFTSPTAQAVVGTATVHGRQALRAYWHAALARVDSLRFTVDHVAWDPRRRELVIVYLSESQGQTRRISEQLTFDADGLVIAGEVFHGVAAAT